MSTSRRALTGHESPCFLQPSSPFSWCLRPYEAFRPTALAGTVEIVQKAPESFEGGKSFKCIAEVTAILESMKWYYHACNKCKTGYNMANGSPRCSCKYSVKSPQFRLPVTIKDVSSTMDCIAFYNVGEELVGCTALEASQNMQIEPDNHPPILKTAIGKKRLFNIGLSTLDSTKNPIKYILKKSLTIEDQLPTNLEKTTKDATPSKEKPTEDIAATPPSTKDIQSASGQRSSSHAEENLKNTQMTPITTQTTESAETIQLSTSKESDSKAKRMLEFNNDTPADPLAKQQKTH